MEYEHRIVPSVLAERVMATACVIATEWADDLTLMHAENDRATERHRQSVFSSGTGDAERRLTLPVFCDATRDRRGSPNPNPNPNSNPKPNPQRNPHPNPNLRLTLPVCEAAQ